MRERYLSSQPLERQSRGSNHMTQSIQEQIGTLPPIEAEGHLVQIGGEMLGRDAMPRSQDAALQQGERRFDGVGMDVSVYVNLSLVLNRLMLWSKGRTFESSGVGIQFICHYDFNIFAHIVSDVLRQCSCFDVLRVEESEFATALPNANHDLLIGIAISCFTVGVLLPAKVGFVYLDSTVHHGTFCFFHSSTYAMAEIPCSFVAHPDSALDLIRRDSLPRFAEKQCDHKPLLQREMGVVEDRSSSHRELILTLSAPKQFDVSREADNVLSFAAWTLRAIGPAQTFQQFAAFVVGWEQFNNIRESHSVTMEAI
jgi:hypothetical protein